ncbi:PEGA domain-containing protein [Candidatus Poribacteria bacterium]|nr:PEGA domain-containing protein [Candidatus Poribacteria bacterium]
MAKALVIILLILSIGGILFYYFIYTGVITIQSSRPPNAQVFINGEFSGETPLKKRIRARDYHVVVKSDGFEPWESNVKVSGTSPTFISVRLRFLVRSEPTEAELVLDGKSIGKTNIAVDVEPGMHSFEFKKEGYKKAMFTANIPENPRDPLPVARLSPAETQESKEDDWSVQDLIEPGVGAIQVTSTPDAKVYLDGVLQGETPLTIPAVPTGDYVLTLSRDGYRDYRKTVYVRKDQTSKIAGKLTPETK